MVHNHPGGTLCASKADLQVTGVMIQAGHIVGIDVVDHIIVAHGKFMSIREKHPSLFSDSP